MGNLAHINSHLAALIEHPHEEHGSIEPWFIARAEPNRHARAKEAMLREGFEVYYPVGRIVKHPALNALPSKTRHRLRHLVIKVERPVFGAYMMFRRMYGGFDVWRIYELTGVIGVCCFGDRLATIEDYVVEGMRELELARGYDEHVTTSEFNARLATGPGAKEVHNSEHRLVGRLDKPEGTVLFVETLGRVTRIISRNEDVPAAR